MKIVIGMIMVMAMMIGYNPECTPASSSKSHDDLPDRPPPEPDGYLEGYVYDACSESPVGNTGAQPIRGVNVCLVRGSEQLCDKSSFANGHYRINDYSGGTYLLIASHDDYRVDTVEISLSRYSQYTHNIYLQPHDTTCSR